jgi:hypothetical protein
MKPAKRLSTLLFILALFLPLQAQAITPATFPFFHVTDPSTGMPEVGGLVWTYQAGTSTQSATYKDTGFSQANAFPIVLDSDGNCIIYANQPTKFVIEGPPPSGQTHGTVLFTFDLYEVDPYNSYVTVGSVAPPTPASGQLSLYCSGTTLYIIDSTGAVTSSATAQAIQQQSFNAAAGGGTGDTITATFTPAITSFVDKTLVWVWASAANTTATPTFSPNGMTAKTIVKGAGAALIPGDIPGANAVIELEYNATLGDWILVNPKYPFIPLTAAMFHNTVITVTGSSTLTITAANNPFAGGGLSLSLNAGTTGANGLDTGSPVASTWYYVYVCNGSSGTCGLLSLSSTTPTAPGGYNNYFIRIGAVQTIPNTYSFTIASSSVTAGALYTTGSGVYFVATATISNQTSLSAYGVVAPPSSGTLTLVAGTGAGTIAFSANTTSSSPALYYTIQRGRHAQYVVQSGNTGTFAPNLNLPMMIYGAVGSISTPTWIPVATSGFVPPTAGTIRVLANAGPSGSLIVAPNSTYGGESSSFNPPFCNGYSAASYQVEMILEGSNIYYAGNGGASELLAIGWEDNL